MPENSARLLEPTPAATKKGTPHDPVPPGKVCLIILFNHSYENNLPKLDWVYRDRFAHIRYLMPFYRGDRPDVFPVYYSSFQFEGFYMEAWKRLRGEGFTHFLFCADDMILHPGLNDQNLCAQLGLDADTGYIKQLSALSDQPLAWFATASGLVAAASKNGVNWERELPDPAAAAANLEAKGYRLGRLGWRNFRQGIRLKGFFQLAFYFVLRWQRRRKDGSTDLLGLPYPLLAGISDLVVVPAAAMEKFSFYCAVFAAMGLFVEIAAPTALALSCPRVVCEADTRWTSRDHWGGREDLWKAFCQKYDYRLDRLLADFGDQTLCIHPIKFSEWNCPERGR